MIDEYLIRKNVLMGLCENNSDKNSVIVVKYLKKISIIGENMLERNCRHFNEENQS